MKKILAFICAIVILGTLFACGAKECELCGENKKLKKYTIEDESYYLCEDCGAIADLANSVSNWDFD